jgi:hypothetical protein
MLQQHECYHRIKAVNIAPVLETIPSLRFVDSGGKCALVTAPDSIAPKPMVKLLNELGLGGTPKRVFCRKLMPGQGILPHVDDWMPDDWKMRRFHIPLTSDPSILMRWPDDNQEVYLEPGYLWEVRVDRLHEVVNNWDGERIHIQIDQAHATI